MTVALLTPADGLAGLTVAAGWALTGADNWLRKSGGMVSAYLRLVRTGGALSPPLGTLVTFPAGYRPFTHVQAVLNARVTTGANTQANLHVVSIRPNGTTEIGVACTGAIGGALPSFVDTDQILINVQFPAA